MNHHVITEGVLIGGVVGFLLSYITTNVQYYGNITVVDTNKNIAYGSFNIINETYYSSIIVDMLKYAFLGGLCTYIHQRIN